MPRFKLIIEYAGTRYSGWQIQKNARTVQGEIDRAVREVTKRRESCPKVWESTPFRAGPSASAPTVPPAAAAPMPAMPSKARSSMR